VDISAGVKPDIGCRGKEEKREVDYPGVPVAQGHSRMGTIIGDFGEVLRG